MHTHIYLQLFMVGNDLHNAHPYLIRNIATSKCHQLQDGVDVPDVCMYVYMYVCNLMYVCTCICMYVNLCMYV